MLYVVERGSTEEQIRRLRRRIDDEGFRKTGAAMFMQRQGSVHEGATRHAYFARRAMLQRQALLQQCAQECSNLKGAVSEIVDRRSALPPVSPPYTEIFFQGWLGRKQDWHRIHPGRAAL